VQLYVQYDALFSLHHKKTKVSHSFSFSRHHFLLPVSFFSFDSIENQPIMPPQMVQEGMSVTRNNHNDGFDKSELDDYGEDSSGAGTGSEGGNSHDGSSTGQSSNRTGGSSGSGGVGDDQDNIYFAKKENMNVQRLKFLVMGILFCVTTAVCLAVYFVTANGQQDEFEATYVPTGMVDLKDATFRLFSNSLCTPLLLQFLSQFRWNCLQSYHQL
jgi:hypothetical protein